MNDSSFNTCRASALATARSGGVVFIGDRVEHATTRYATTAARPHRESGEPMLDVESSEFFRWLCDARGVRADRYRSSVIRRRQAACLRAAGCASLIEARQRLERDPVRLDRALSAVLIGVTAFFRDTEPFLALASELDKPTWRRPRRINVLCVGCSDGHEVYSIAMLLADAGLLDTSTLTGIDCRADAIAMAERGIYAGDALANVPDSVKARWFRPVATGYQVASELRERTRWRVADAFTIDQSAQFDIVVCRNLAIYLRPEAAGSLWSLLASCLKAGGLLMAGKAERPPATVALCKIAPCLFVHREIR